MARGIVPPRVMVEAFVPQARTACHGPCLSRSRGELVRGGDLLWRVHLVGKWLEMLPTRRKHDVLPVWVLTGVLNLPRLESWP
jgi:hypothetical protein